MDIPYDQSILFCPSAQIQDASTYAADYSMNVFLGASLDSDGQPVTYDAWVPALGSSHTFLRSPVRVEQYPNKVVLGDAIGAPEFTAWNQVRMVRWRHGAGTNAHFEGAPDYLFAAPPEASANFVFTDGHVQSFQYADWETFWYQYCMPPVN